MNTSFRATLSTIDSIQLIFKVMKHFLLMTFLLLTLQIIVAAQPKSVTFSPPDKSFSVELPTSAKLEKPKRNAEDSSGNELFGGIKANAGNGYLIKLTSDENYASVSVGSLVPLKPLDRKTFIADVNSYMLFLFGDNKHFSREADTVVNGFSGREFVFEKGSGSGRALFVNSGKRIYMLTYFEEEDGQPTSEIINKLFASFKPMK